MQNLSFSEKVFEALGTTVVVDVLRSIFVDRKQVDDARAGLYVKGGISGVVCDA